MRLNNVSKTIHLGRNKDRFQTFTVPGAYAVKHYTILFLRTSILSFFAYNFLFSDFSVYLFFFFFFFVDNCVLVFFSSNLEGTYTIFQYNSSCFKKPHRVFMESVSLNTKSKNCIASVDGIIYKMKKLVCVPLLSLLSCLNF